MAIPERPGGILTKNLAFVLSGGGSRGALQLGALYAVEETGLRPDMLIGTSIGALNAAFLALHGFSREGLDLLKATWRRASTMDLLPSNYVRLAFRAVLRRSTSLVADRIRDFFIEEGFNPELSFAEFRQPRLFIVSSDLNSGEPVIHGDSPEEKVLEGLLLSTALPPWVRPVRKQGRYLMDGGVVSNLPVEPALRMGAQQVLALDLLDTRELFAGARGVATFIDRLSMSVEKRQTDLELELAEARGIPTLYVGLTGENPIPQWDFRQTEELIERGYELTRLALEEQEIPVSFLE